MRPSRFLLPLLALAMPLTAPAADPDTRLYEMRVYTAAPGKLDDLNARFRDHTLKLFEKYGIANIGYFVPADNPDNKLVYFLAYKDADARRAGFAKFGSDPEWQEAVKKTEANGRLATKVDSYFLKATDYSPAIAPKAADKERVFELRTYTASPGKLGNLNARFRDHTLKLFEKHGMANVAYWTLATGPGIQNPNAAALKSLGVVAGPDEKAADVTMVYLLAHPSAEARDKAFGAFRNDPDWKKALAASEEKAGGPLTAKDGVKSLLLKPTDYSPMK